MDLVQPSVYFTHPINWSVNPIYTRSYVCSVKKAVTGREQRSLLNNYPRRSLKYTIITSSQKETYYFKKYLRSALHLVWGVPIWMYEMFLTSNVAASGTVLNVDSTNYIEMVAGQEVILYRNFDNFEVATISTAKFSITTTTITLDAGLSNGWPSGTKVYPILRSELGSVFDFEVKIPSIMMAEVMFTESYRGSY